MSETATTPPAAANAYRVSSPLLDPDALPLLPPSVLAAWGRATVIAPHEDDESLGCGGAIALLRAMGAAVSVLFASDGTRSHPRSRLYPADTLRTLREREAHAALDILGVVPTCRIFLRLTDSEVPGEGAAGFGQAVRLVAAHLAGWQTETLLVPWRRDFHCDHRAVWEIVRAAVRDLPRPPRIIEYPIWVWEHQDAAHLPRHGEMTAWRLDIAAMLPQKRAAIAAHRSQMSPLIPDDPGGFVMSPEIRERFERPYEIYLEDAQ